MKQWILALTLFAATAATAQKTIRDANAAPRDLGHFHAINISGGIDLYLTQGNEEGVAVSASKNEYRDRIVTEVHGGVLHIFYKDENMFHMGINFGNRKLKAYVSVKELDKLEASGGSDIYVESDLHVPGLSLHISGGSDFRGSVRTKELSLSASGGSDAYISGEAEQVNISSSGGSDVHGFDLVTGTCSIDCSGGSDVRITANKELSGRASGGSDIYYKGNAVSNGGRGKHNNIKKVS